ncbi:hypothetical protein PIB30_097363, partial [Stylosanthes scabra]|nr:hypothetical protein [Stylosanthes scabra]
MRKKKEEEWGKWRVYELNVIDSVRERETRGEGRRARRLEEMTNPCQDLGFKVVNLGKRLCAKEPSLSLPLSSAKEGLLEIEKQRG